MEWRDKLSVEFEICEITALEADALMCPISIQLEEYGKISQKVLRLGGTGLAQELQKAKAALPEGKMLLGDSCVIELSDECAIGTYDHLILTALWDRQSEYTKNLFYNAYLTAFRASIDRNLVSLVVPAMGYDGNLPTSSTALLQVINDLGALANASDFTLVDICVVSSNENHIEYLRSHIEPAIYR